jgi:uncharacterized membrane protein
MKIEYSVVINRPVETVFAYVANLENLKQWQSGLIESRPITPGKTGVGSKVPVVRQLLGQKLEGVAEVVAFEPDRVVVGAGDRRLDVSYSHQYL